MFRDLFDRLHLLALVGVVIAIALLLGGFTGSDDKIQTQRRDPALDRAMQEKARAAFLLETYAPVEELIAGGRSAEALLRLQEFEKAYPGEPHTQILRGAILVDQGVLGEGVSQYATAVRMNGDYVDANSSLNRRDEIDQLIVSALPKARESVRRNATAAGEKTLKELYYLQSRLAGGCE